MCNAIRLSLSLRLNDVHVFVIRVRQTWHDTLAAGCMNLMLVLPLSNLSDAVPTPSHSCSNGGLAGWLAASECMDLDKLTGEPLENVIHNSSSWRVGIFRCCCLFAYGTRDRTDHMQANVSHSAKVSNCRRAIAICAFRVGQQKKRLARVINARA